MQTLAKYLFGLFFFILVSLTREEPVKEEIADRCTPVKSETLKVCALKENLEYHI